MNQSNFKKFTLEKANRLLPTIIELTRNTVRQLEDVRMKREAEYVIHGEEAEISFQKNINRLLDAWAHEIVKLGVMPKGFFTCDFITPNPERLFCWTLGEVEIGHTHKVTESFKDRTPLKNPELQGFEISLN